MVEIPFPVIGVRTKHVAFLPTAVGFTYAFRVALIFLWFQDAPTAGSAVSIGLSIALLLAALFYNVTSLQGRPHQSSLPGTLKFIFAYLALALVSLLWTTTQSMPVALGYWCAMCADVLTVILLLRTRDAEEEALSIVKGFVVGSAVVAAIAWLAPVMDDLRLGNEDFLHPNAIGFEFALATLCALYLSREGRIWKWLGVIPGVTLLRTLSKASILAFLPAAGFYLLRASSIRRRTKVLVAIGAVLVSLSFLSLIDAYVEQYAQGSQLETLTGRTLIWAESLDIALDKPWLGHGFYSYRWLVPPFGTFEAWQAHDELLQQFFSYGLVGILLSVALYYGFFRQLRRHPPDNLRTLATALLIFALLRGLVDTDIFGLSFPLWLMAMLTIWLDSRRATGSRHNACELRV